MSAIRVRTQIPESREITVTLPPDVPVGEAEIELVVRPTSEMAREFEIVLPADDRPRQNAPRPSSPELAAECDAFEAMLPNLMTRYAGKHVALRGGAVVAVGDTEVDALTEARRLLPSGPIYVRFVIDQPLPIPRSRSPRVVRRVV